MSDDLSPQLGGQTPPSDDAPALTGDRALLHALEMLHAPDEQTRQEAAFALAELGDARAIEHLVRILRGSIQPLRDPFISAAWLLAQFGERALPSLARLAHDSDPDVAASGLVGLRFIPCDAHSTTARKAARILIDLLDYGGREQQHAAATHIGQLLDDQKFWPGFVAAMLRTAEAPPASRGTPAWSIAVSTLGMLKEPHATPRLLSVLRRLDDPDFILQSFVIVALGNMGDRRAVPGLIAELEDVQSHLRGVSAGLLGHIRDERAVPVLARIADDPDEPPRLRRSCRRALAELDGASLSG